MVLQKQLYEIGVDMEIEALPHRELVKRMKRGDFDTVLMERTSGRSLAWTYMTFHSTQDAVRLHGGRHGAGSTAPDHDDARGRSAVSDLQQVLHDDPPAIFIAWPKVARVVSSKFVVPPLGEDAASDVISNLWQWKPAGTAAMRRITSRFVLLIASAAIAPLVVYGVVSIVGLRTGTESVRHATATSASRSRSPNASRNTSTTTRASCRSIGLELRGIDLQQWQQARVLKDYVLDFPEFREISFFAAAGV